jgi:hypothetical protein
MRPKKTRCEGLAEKSARPLAKASENDLGHTFQKILGFRASLLLLLHIEQYRCRQNQQSAQVFVSLLTDVAQPLFASARMLTGNKAHPSGKIGDVSLYIPTTGCWGDPLDTIAQSSSVILVSMVGPPQADHPWIIEKVIWESRHPIFLEIRPPASVNSQLHIKPRVGFMGENVAKFGALAADTVE